MKQFLSILLLLFDYCLGFVHVVALLFYSGNWLRLNLKQGSSTIAINGDGVTSTKLN